MIGWRAAFVCWLLASVVACQAAEPAVDFDHTVLPILTQAGCNAGACHGAAIGRGGFRLSLYGQDPAADFDRIARQLGGRRVNSMDPESSLLLRKAGEFIEHGGGMPLPPDGEGWQTIARWVAEGCRRDGDRQLTSIRAEPSQWLLRLAAPAAQVQIIAHLDDGTETDATRWSLLTADDPDAIHIGRRAGSFVAKRPGRHTIIARLRDQVTAIEVVVPADTADTVAAPHRSSSRLDRWIDEKLALLGLAPNDPVEDAGFLRRVSLDLTGRLPTPEALDALATSRRVDKRRRAIDRLLSSEAAVDYWTYWLARTLRAGPQRPADGASAGWTTLYHAWLREQIAACEPLPQLVGALLTAEGAADENGAVGFYLSANDARSQAELFSEVFLGSRLRCANCHNHPLDRWTQNDYHGLAAIFAGVSRGSVVAWREGRDVIHPATGEAAVPQLPGGPPLLRADADFRPLLAQWLTDSENPLLARVWVNRVWAALMGRGLIDPVDDLRTTNPATHPALLDELAADWRAHNFDLRYLVRRIASTDAYARSVQGHQDQRSLAETWYARGSVRALHAEVWLDAVGDVTEVWERFDRQPAGTRAVELTDPTIASDALDALGRCPVGMECQSTGSEQPGLSQKLTLMCGPLINARIADPRGSVAHWSASDAADNRTVIQAMYRRCLSRTPRDEELHFWISALQQADDRSQTIEDLAWSLLTCREFSTNH